MKADEKEELIFDDGTSNAPDAYGRNQNSVILFEFKAYLLPDRLPETPDFDEIKKYIDERFVINKAGKSKGIGQLVYQIEQLARESRTSSDKLAIYPVLCIDEFYFTMPGINDYLNQAFVKLLSQDAKEKFAIRNLTIISLETLFDFYFREGKFSALAILMDRYWIILENSWRSYLQSQEQNDFLNSHSSFDEIYDKIFQTEMADAKKANFIADMLALAAITQEIVDAVYL